MAVRVYLQSGRGDLTYSEALAWKETVRGALQVFGPSERRIALIAAGEWVYAERTDDGDEVD